MPTSIISKLSLLVLHFPRLRLVWSRSLHATAEIFASLKANQDEPDESKAMRVGVPTEEGFVENDARWEVDLTLRISNLFIFYLFLFFFKDCVALLFSIIFGSQWDHHEAMPHLFGFILRISVNCILLLTLIIVKETLLCVCACACV